MAYTPFERMDELVEQMRRDMEAFRMNARGLGEGRGRSRAGTDAWDSNVRVSERDGAYVVTADLPGFETEDLDVRLVEDALHIDAERTDDDATASRRRAVSERITLIKPVLEDEIAASYRNGVLEIVLPIDGEEAETGHRIDIE